MMIKKCGHCKTEKDLKEFFQAPKDAASSWQGTSEFCIKCHDAGYIKYGYGYYEGKWRNPSETK